MAELSHCLSDLVKNHVEERPSESFWNFLLYPLCLGQHRELETIEHLRTNSVAEISAAIKPLLDSGMIFPIIPFNLFNSPVCLLKNQWNVANVSCLMCISPESTLNHSFHVKCVVTGADLQSLSFGMWLLIWWQMLSSLSQTREKKKSNLHSYRSQSSSESMYCLRAILSLLFFIEI